jgi:hypothetical protein
MIRSWAFIKKGTIQNRRIRLGKSVDIFFKA